MDALFLRQVWAGNEALLLELAEDASPLGRARLARVPAATRGPGRGSTTTGPSSRASRPKPRGRQLLSGGRDQGGGRELDREALPAPSGTRRATGFFTTIRRAPGGGLTVVPYSVEYQGELARAAALLREAAALTTQPTLKTFLDARADAFLSNDYYDSDVAWMELDAAIEPTIGPYEVYEDELVQRQGGVRGVHHRAGRRRDREAGALRRASCRSIENHLPIDPALRNPKLGALAPIRVVNVVFAAGDANRGVQTAAFNLPNDERIAAEKGSKRVDAEERAGGEVRRRCCMPIAQVALVAGRPAATSPFDAFFTHILMHELMHGLGPHSITVDGRQTTVRAGAEGDLQRDRGGEGGHLRALCAAVPRRQGRARRGDGARRCTRRSWRRRSARSASASTRRTARAWRSS